MFEHITALLKDSGIYGISSILTSMIGIILIPIYTRVFIPAEYAIVDIITTLSAILTIIIIMGFETAQTFFFFDTDDIHERKSIITTVLLHRFFTSVIICSPMMVFAPVLSELLFKDPSNTIYIQISLVTVIFSVLISEIQDVLRITKNAWNYLILIIGYTSLNALLTVILIYFYDFGLYGLYVSALFSSAIFCLIGLFKIRIHLFFSPSREKMLAMLRYALPLVPSGLSIWVMNFADRYVLLQYVQLTEIGLYSLAIKGGLAISFIGGAFRLSWNPIAFSVKDRPEGPLFYSLVFKWYLLLIIVICTFTSLFAYEALTVFTTPLYYGAHTYVAPVVFSQAAWNLIPILALGCLYRKKTMVNLLAFGFASLLNLSLNLIFVPHFGVMASASATLVSYLVALGIFIHYSQKYYPIPFQWVNAAKLCSISGIIIIAGYTLDQTPGMITTVMKGLLLLFYFLLILMFSIVDHSEIESIKKYGVNLINSFKNRIA